MRYINPLTFNWSERQLVPAGDVSVTPMQWYRANLVAGHHYQPVAMAIGRMSSYTNASHRTAVVKHRNHFNHIRLNFNTPSVDGLQNSTIICNIECASLHKDADEAHM